MLTVACANDNQEARTPQAMVEVDKQHLEVNESMTIRFTGVADQVVVYTGDKDHQYELRDSSNTGLVVNRGVLTYSYAVPGTFHVVCVATTYDTYMGGGLKTDTTGLDIVVYDDVTTIDAIYATVTPNVYVAVATGDDWVMCLPEKQLYNGREMTVNAARQRLSIEAGSDSAKVYIDGELYVSKNYYALNADHEIRVVSGSGTEKVYRFYGMIYPEFKTLTIGGGEAVLTRSAYEFTVTKSYERKLTHRQILLSEKVNRRTVIHPVLITTFGLTYNEYSGVFNHTITMDDLFEK